MRILGFGHRKRVGKDTAVTMALSYLRQNHPKISSTRLSFGDQVKIVSKTMYSWAGLKDGVYYENNPELKEHRLEKINKSPRDIWIEVGNMARSIDPCTWTEMACSGCKADIALSPDLRDPSEVKLIERVGGFAIRIDRADAPIGVDPVDSALIDYTGWHRIVKNDATLRDLNLEVVNITKEFLNEFF